MVFHRRLLSIVYFGAHLLAFESKKKKKILIEKVKFFYRVEYTRYVYDVFFFKLI